MKTKRQKTEVSQTIKKILSEIPQRVYERTENKMLLAKRIDEARQKAGLTKKDFANMLNKTPSVISRWLSGTHNFTIDTLWDIEKALNVELINLYESKSAETIVKYQTIYVKQNSFSQPCEYEFFIGYEDPENYISEIKYNIHGERN